MWAAWAVLSNQIAGEVHRFVLSVIADKHKLRAVWLVLAFGQRLIGVEDAILH